MLLKMKLVKINDKESKNESPICNFLSITFVYTVCLPAHVILSFQKSQWKEMSVILTLIGDMSLSQNTKFLPKCDYLKPYFSLVLKLS